MAKDIVHTTHESETAESIEATALAVPKFQAVVFKQLPPTADFASSEAITVGGAQTEAAAWAAVRAALRAGGADLIGGEVRACAR